MKKLAICPLCGSKKVVQKDQWLVDARGATPFYGNINFIGYRTWFYCDCQHERAYIFKWYDEDFRYVCYTASFMLMNWKIK